MSTRARQHKYSSHISPCCIFFGQVEIRDHLFFVCTFTFQIWRSVQTNFPKFQRHDRIREQFVFFWVNGKNFINP